jgi:hypothetical protein
VSARSSPSATSVAIDAALLISLSQAPEPEGCTYSDRGPDQGFPLAPFGWSGPEDCSYEG